MIPAISDQMDWFECWMCGCTSKRPQTGRFRAYMCGMCREAVAAGEHDYVTRCVNALTIELLEIPFDASDETAQIFVWLADAILRVQERTYEKLPPELRKLILGGSSGASAEADA